MHVTECLKAYLPTQDSRFLIWLIDGGGNPVFFVTGLLDVRSGESTRDPAATQERSLLSQITCEQSMQLIPVRYKGHAEFRFYEGDDFYDDDIESFGKWTQAEDSIEHACAEFETFTVTDAEYDGECLSASADISGTVLTSIPWRSSDDLRPDQIAYLKAKTICYLSAGVDCVQDVDVTVDPHKHLPVAAI